MYPFIFGKLLVKKPYAIILHTASILKAMATKLSTISMSLDILLEGSLPGLSRTKMTMLRRMSE